MQAFEARIRARGESDAPEVYAPMDEGAPAEMAMQASSATSNLCAVTYPGLCPANQMPFFESLAMAVTEIDVVDFSNDDAGKAALEKEWLAMTEPAFGSARPRLIEMTDSESARFKDKQGKAFKKMLKLRYACTQKRATPEQLKKDLKAMGKMKARLVAQDLKIFNPANPVDVYAPVPEGCVFRLLIAAHPIKEYDISATDVTTAYLQGDPFDFKEDRPKADQWIATRVLDPFTLTWRFMWMTGEIYGRQPAGCNWHQTLTRKHNNIGMEEGRNAKSVYFNEDRTVKTAVHVDDPVTIAKRSPEDSYPGDATRKLAYYQQLAGELDIKDVETLSKQVDIDYLSLRLSVSDDDEVCISNADFIQKVVESQGLAGCNPAACPISKELMKIVAKETEAGLFLGSEGKTLYQSNAGMLNWIATTFCPKLALTVSMIGKRCANPTVSCPKLIKQAVRWLAGNIDMCLKTRSDDHSGLQVYCDSDHAGMLSVDGEHRSRMGIVAKYNGMTIHWISTWMKAICLSSAEAEVYALSEAVKLALHLKWVCQELNIPIADRIPIHVDASAAISFAENVGGVSQTRLKHIDLREAWVEQIKGNKEIELRKIDGKINPANFLTKILGATQFREEGADLMDRVKLSEAMEHQCKIRGHGDSDDLK